MIAYSALVLQTISEEAINWQPLEFSVTLRLFTLFTAFPLSHQPLITLYTDGV